MIYNRIKAVLGCDTQDDKLVSFLSSIKISNPNLVLSSGLARIAVKKFGFDLMVSTEKKYGGWVNAKHGSIIGMELFSKGRYGHKQFPDPIPKGILFSDSRSDLTKKLGPPSLRCECGKNPVCFEQWCILNFDNNLSARITHHLPNHVGNRNDLVEIYIHMPHLTK